MVGWKSKLGAFIVALASIMKAALPEESEIIDRWLDALQWIGSGVGIYGIRDALGRVGATGGWKGRLGGILVGLGGAIKSFVPGAGPLVDTVLNLIPMLGGALGIFGLRAAVSRIAGK